MKTPLYREALSHSWRFAWRHPSLWVFGLFAAFLGQMGIAPFLLRSSAAITGGGSVSLPETVELAILAVRSILSLSLPLEGWVWFVWLLCVFVGMGILLFIFAAISQAAIVKSVAQSTKHKRASVDISGAWETGVSHLWRVLGINAGKLFLLYLLTVLLGIMATYVVGSSQLFSNIGFVLLFIVVVLAGIVISVVSVYAVGYVVIEERPFGRAIAMAWRLFLDHWLVSLEVGGILLFANILVALVAGMLSLAIILPSVLLTVLGGLPLMAGSLNIALMFGALVAGVLIFFLGAVFVLFTTSVWTYLFMHMHKHGIVSRVLHWFHGRS